MKAVHARRLLKLADFLQTVPRKRFNVRTFGRKLDCGTVACVGGWAGMMPAFRKAGLKMDFDGYNHRNFSLDGKEMDVDLALERFFGTEAGEAQLFYPDGYIQGHQVTPKQAAKRIRQLVREANKENR